MSRSKTGRKLCLGVPVDGGSGGFGRSVGEDIARHPRQSTFLGMNLEGFEETNEGCRPQQVAARLQRLKLVRGRARQPPCVKCHPSPMVVRGEEERKREGIQKKGIAFTAAALQAIMCGLSSAALPTTDLPTLIRHSRLCDPQLLHTARKFQSRSYPPHHIRVS